MHALTRALPGIAQILLLAGAMLLTPHPGHAAAPDPFAENVRTTEPVTPARQQGSFHLPPGFEIELVTSEPNIAKPMNMAFDARGRLWLTTSLEYPFPKKPGEPARDSVKVLEDTDGDGRYDKVTTFADNLNIPIGVLPMGEGCLVWSIPNIWYLRDTDGDGKADRRDVVFGPLGWERDTHGNLSSFRRGPDGWIYGTHGFNNNSTFKARDGSSITLNSGNTYRFRPDGERVEQFTWGQVNPFGMCVDDFGYLYTADCHSSPIYQLIPGGTYPSFGKPDDGLGFAPVMIQHSHGSTAISGIVILPDEVWPAEFRGNVLIGNVMTSRLNRDRVEWTGSSPKGVEMPDFLSTDDPWFRPVDLQIGPDGALYVADFYNRIIGHYEVPLQHPGRDRERGRIWKIRYAGPGSEALPRGPQDLTRMETSQLMIHLGSWNRTLGSLALHQLVERIGMPAAIPARQALADTRGNPRLRAGAVWVLFRLGRLDAELLRGLAADPSSLVRVQAARAIGATTSPSAASRAQLATALTDSDAHVRRAATESMIHLADPSWIPSLLAALERTPATDVHLTQAMRIALRNQFRSGGAYEAFLKREPREGEWRRVADISLGVSSREAGDFLARHLERHAEPAERLARMLRQSARFASPDLLPALAGLAKRSFASDPTAQTDLLLAMRKGVAEKGETIPQVLKTWSSELILALLRSTAKSSAGWENIPWEGSRDIANPWVFQERNDRSGKAVRLISSLAPGGEAMTGTLLSPEFTVPSTLSFLVAGHDGFPDKPNPGGNIVQLRESSSGTVLARAAAPRNDVAQSVTWDLAAHQGKRARLEIVDRNTEAAYAWIAVGGWDPAVIPWPQVAPRDVNSHLSSVTDLAEGADLMPIRKELQAIAQAPAAGLGVAVAAARVLTSASRADGQAALANLSAEPLLPSEHRRRIAASLAGGELPQALEAVAESLKSSPWRSQVLIAQSLAAHPVLATQLLGWVGQSRASARLLLEPAVSTRLTATLPASKDQVTRLTEGLPPADKGLQKLVDDRRAGYNPAGVDIARGEALFVQSCAVCHQIGGKGALVGPQLDGVGNRGIERLCEDILDPNRNVDHAFRTQLIVLVDGEVTGGLPRREEGDSLILANAAGKEFTLSKKTIKERRDSANSLMPENFGELLTPADFNSLLGYLLSQAKDSKR